jgi:mannose-6-phosphate isomerase-like protein (cupin superfamily)
MPHDAALARRQAGVHIQAKEVAEMPKVSKENAKYQDYGPVESWSEEVDGNAIEFVYFKQDIDSTPMLKGLPNDECTCPHWGYVLKGKVTFTIDGVEEVYEPGDAFYVPPGHLQRADGGTEYLQFSPAKEMAVVEQQIMKNMQEMQGV